MKFTYSSGERPLDGYTIKRGIGRGGFGEVYYALSDGGKEVALKLVQSNLEIELRGMTQCLNLKHPNLVLLYDLRTDANGDHWVVMEYVGGESLSSILNRHPNGVGIDLARQWFGGLAAAIGYLHDHGIVHRDLKPGNIFLEAGAIKVGDYGLCKFIGGSQRTGQTQSVGTVHYMAPEISTGNYNRQIDIYAAGVILYELLTGHVPFDGESAGEILMKHMTMLPDLSKVPSPFVPILDKALAKNTALRYRTMMEMARDVEAVGGSTSPKPLPIPETMPWGIQPVPPTTIIDKGQRPVRTRVGQACAALVLAAGLACVLTLLWATVTRNREWADVAKYFFLAVSCSWAVLIPAAFWTNSVEESWKRRAVLLGAGVLVGLEALWIDGHFLPSTLLFENQATHDSVIGAMSVTACYLLYFGLAFLVIRWWKMAEVRRPERFSLFAVLVTIFWAYVLYLLIPGGAKERQTFFVALVMVPVIVQLVSPWERPAQVPSSKRLRLRYTPETLKEAGP
jgi:hypothetical protein